MAKLINDQDAAAEVLRAFISPGDTLRTLNVYTSRSGMTRWIRVLVVDDGEIADMSYHVAKALGWSYNSDRQAVKVEGCGMDMGFHLVYSLSSKLFPVYACMSVVDGRRHYCPSADHANLRDAAPTTHRDGYALSHRWL